MSNFSPSGNNAMNQPQLLFMEQAAIVPRCSRRGIEGRTRRADISSAVSLSEDRGTPSSDPGAYPQQPISVAAKIARKSTGGQTRRALCRMNAIQLHLQHRARG